MIDRGLPPEGWPALLQDTVSHFHQGHVINFVPCAYAANFEHPIWLASRQVADRAAGGDFAVIRQAWPHCMIVSQTCDICEEGRRKLLFPWITVVPVYDIFESIDKGKRKLVSRGQVGYLVPLTAAPFKATGQLFVADLRLEYPAEKGRLVGQEARSGFESDADILQLGRTLAERRNRPAIDDIIYQCVLRPLRLKFERNEIAHDAIEEVRLRVEPSLQHVERLVLYVVISDHVQQGTLQSKFETFLIEANATLGGNITLVDIKVDTADGFKYSEMRPTLRITYDDLSSE